MTALDVAFGVGPTPIAMLIVLLVLVAVVSLVLGGGSQALGRLVDRRWPADEALTPSELLWGEVGGHVQKAFPGLDPEIARDLSPYVRETKVKAGAPIVEAGEPATHYFLVIKGEVEVESASPTRLKPGQHFGDRDILHRSAVSATVRAVADTTLVSLPADDYIAGLALSADLEDADYVDHAMADLAATAPAAAAAPPPTPAAPAPVAPPAPVVETPPPPPPAPEPEPVMDIPPPAPAPEPAPAPAAGWADATHTASGELDGFPLPEGETATRVLAVGTEVVRIEGLPGWSHVRTQDGWQGWVRDAGLTPR
jgi:hypothetical protein